MTRLCRVVLQLRLNAEQIAEKKAAEAAVAEIKALMDDADDATPKDTLELELAARQSTLDELMDGFEVSVLAQPVAIAGICVPAAWHSSIGALYVRCMYSSMCCYTCVMQVSEEMNMPARGPATAALTSPKRMTSQAAQCRCLCW